MGKVNNLCIIFWLHSCVWVIHFFGRGEAASALGRNAGAVSGSVGALTLAVAPHTWINQSINQSNWPWTTTAPDPLNHESINPWQKHSIPENINLSINQSLTAAPHTWKHQSINKSIHDISTASLKTSINQSINP